MNSDGLARAARTATRSPSGMKVSSVAGHDHAVFAGLLDLVAQHQREFEDDVFSISPLAALVPLSMPPWPGSITISGRGSPFGLGVALGGCRLRSRRPVLERDGAHERLAVGGREFEHQPRRLIVGGVDHEGLVDPRRTGQIDARCASRPA